LAELSDKKKLLKYGLLLVLILGSTTGLLIARKYLLVDKRIVGIEKLPAHPFSFSDIDHGSWDRLLQNFVDGEGRVDYALWSQDGLARQDLKDYLRALSAVDPSFEASQTDRLAC